MPELGEMVNVDEIVDDEWECPFAHGDKSPTVDNLLTNSSDTLGKNMDKGTSTSRKEPKTDKIDHPEFDTRNIETKWDKKTELSEDGFNLRILLNPHHLVPGEASLPKSDIMVFVTKDHKFIKSDIGYVVNGAQNGVWLPSHSAAGNWGNTLRKDGVVKLKTAEDLKAHFLQREYAFVAMEFCQAQFHDSHPDYSAFVVQCLNKVFIKCWAGTGWCEECKKETSPMPPPYGLIKRIDAISARLIGFLMFPYAAWRPPVYTSAWALDFRAHYLLRASH